MQDLVGGAEAQGSRRHNPSPQRSSRSCSCLDFGWNHDCPVLEKTSNLSKDRIQHALGLSRTSAIGPYRIHKPK